MNTGRVDRNGNVSVNSLGFNGRSSSLGQEFHLGLQFQNLIRSNNLHRWLAWNCDAIDFFSVSLSVTNLEAQFHKSAHEMTTSITLTLLFRSVGAVSHFFPIQLCVAQALILTLDVFTDRSSSASFLIDLVVNGLWFITSPSVASFN